MLMPFNQDPDVAESFLGPMRTPSLSTCSNSSQSTHDASSEPDLPLLAVRLDSVALLQAQIAKGYYSLTIRPGQYIIYLRSLSNSLHTNFRQTDVAAATCDKKSGLVSVKLTNNSRWDLEFEKGDDAKTVAHALIS